MTLDSVITKPTLLLDENKARRNLNLFIEKIVSQNILFRPHFKTHQSIEIGRWFLDKGISKITVSSVEMAEYFANNGWNDILIAFPVNLREIESITNLSKSISLSLLVESIESIEFLNKMISHPIQVWIKIDVGAGRTGIAWKNLQYIEAIARIVQSSKNMSLSGILTHAGHTYHAAGKPEIKQIYQLSLERLLTIKNYLESQQLGPIKISVGDTPSTSVVENFGEIDEIRPGNFLFYDVQQFMAGVCTISDIAVAVACPVVASHKYRQEATIYGGAIHFSKDYFQMEDGINAYGLAVEMAQDGWNDQKVIGYIKSLSQEHGVIKVNEGEMDKFQPGKIICILPAHSCLTVHALRDFINLDGTRITTLNSRY